MFVVSIPLYIEIYFREGLNIIYSNDCKVHHPPEMKQVMLEVATFIRRVCNCFLGVHNVKTDLAEARGLG